MASNLSLSDSVSISAYSETSHTVIGTAILVLRPVSCQTVPMQIKI